jgi:uncharacterized protein (TIGR02996 family)
LTVELFEEVLAHPHSDDPRRIYADWLSERGDPRGEFVAVQCELARAFDPDLAERERQLLAEHGARWVEQLELRKCERLCAMHYAPCAMRMRSWLSSGHLDQRA